MVAHGRLCQARTGWSVNQLQGVSGSGNDVWAVGQYDLLATTISHDTTLDGSAWSHVPSPILPSSTIVPLEPQSVVEHVWAVGYSIGGMSNDHPCMDGSAWSLLPSPTRERRCNSFMELTGRWKRRLGRRRLSGSHLELHDGTGALIARMILADSSSAGSSPRTRCRKSKIAAMLR